MSKGEKTLLFIRDNVGYMTIFIVLAIYIFRGLVNIDNTGKTIEAIIVDSAIAWILALSISRVFERQGFIAGYKDERYIKTKELHGNMVDAITPDYEYLDDFCAEQTRNALKIRRTNILNSAGMPYYKYFDDTGVAIMDAFTIPKAMKPKHLWFIKWSVIDKVKEKRNKVMRKALKKALKARVTPLTTNALTGKAGNYYDPFDFGMTEKTYLAKSGIKDAVSKLAIGVIFGYYGVKILQNPDWGYIIWTSVQAGTFLIAGVMKFLAAFIFIIEDVRDAIIKKVDNMQKFKNVDKARYKVVEPNGNRV